MKATTQLMARIPGSEVVLKLSRAGSIVRFEGFREQVRAEPVTRPVVDTTAAGDSFAAAYIAARLAGAEPAEAARAGHRLGGVVVCYPGAIIPRSAMPPNALPDHGNLSQGLTMTAKQDKLAALFKSARVIPVITIDRLEDAVPLAKALVAGGVRVLEVTLRTPVAIEAAKAMMAEVPEAIVGIGTILNAADLARAEALGAKFGISPGATPELLEAAAASALPFAPGIATASELMQALAHGFNLVKFFPAETVRRHQGASRAWRGLFRMCGFARPAASARPMRRHG